MTEKHSDIRIKMAAVFVIIAAALATVGIIISWNRHEEIGPIIASVGIPFLYLAMYYEIFWNKDGKVKP